MTMRSRGLDGFLQTVTKFQSLNLYSPLFNIYHLYRFLLVLCFWPLNYSVNSLNDYYEGDLSEEAYPRGFGLIKELFSGSESSKNKNLVSDGEL